MQSPASPSLRDLKQSVLLSYLQCSERGLLYSANWAIELANSIAPSEDVALPQVPHSALFSTEFTAYSLGRSQFDLREYRRAAHWLKNCASDEGFFLKCYSLYLAGEKDKDDNTIDALGPEDMSTIANEELLGLRKELLSRAENSSLDGFSYFLLGVVCKEMKLVSEAQKMFLQSIQLTPLLWGAWDELARLCESRDMLYNLELPNHWLRDFFYAAASLKLGLSNDALAYYSNLRMVGFSQSPYVIAQLAQCNYNLQNMAEASGLFESLRNMDPYRLSDMDTFSNVLFVQEKLPELSRLAQDVVKFDRYRPESCSVLGNFYGLRGDHEKAIAYFRRAVRLNHNDHLSWILLGHEYFEMTNCSMAIEAYTRALEANKKDFRGYYGLGHTYEVMNMWYFALYYYKQAHKLSPSEPRVLEAMGTCYIELNQNSEAKKCLTRAVANKESVGTAIVKLAKLHAKLNEREEAAKLYTRFCATIATSETDNQLPEEEGPAHLFLAKYHLKNGSYREAEAHANKCIDYDVTCEEGKSILREAIKLALLLESGDKRKELSILHPDQELSPIS